MPIKYKNSQASSLAATGTSLTLTLPSGLAAGDFMLAAVHVKLNVTTGGMTGWTKVSQQQNGTTGTLAVYWRFWQSGDAAPAVTWTGAAKAAGGISVYTGVHATPLDTALVWNTGTSANPLSLSVTPATKGAFRVMFNGVAANLTAESNWNPSSGGFPGFRRYDSLSTGGSTGTRNTLNQWDEPQMMNTALGDMAFVLTSSAWITGTLALRPATSPTFARYQPGADWTTSITNTMSRTINRTPTSGSVFFAGLYTDISASGGITGVTIGGLAMTRANVITSATHEFSLWYLPITSAGVGTTLVATKTGTGLTGMWYSEWGGGIYTAGDPLDQTGTNSGTDASPTATTGGATQSQTEFVYHTNWAATTSLVGTPDTGFLADMFQGANPYGYFSQAGETAGGSSVSATMGIGAAVQWYSIISTFMTAAPAGGTQTDQTFPVAAQVLKTQEQPFTAAAQVRRNDTDASFAAAAQVRKNALEGAYITAAQVRATLAASYLVGAQVLSTLSGAYDVGAQVRQNAVQATFAVAAQVVAPSVQTDQTFATGAQVRRADNEASFALAAQVRASIEAGYALAAQTRAEMAVAFQTAAQVRQNTIEGAFAAAAQIRQNALDGAYTVGAQVRAEQNQTYAVAAQVVEAVSGQVNQTYPVAAQVRANSVAAQYTLGAQVRQNNIEGQYAAAAQVRVEQNGQYTAAAQVRAVLTGTFLVAAQTVEAVAGQVSQVYDTAAQVQATLTGTYAVAAQVLATPVETDQTFTLAAQLRAEQTPAYDVATQVRATAEGAYGVAAQVRAEQEAAYEVAAQVRGGAEGAYQLAAQVRQDAVQATYPLAVQLRAVVSGTYLVAAQTISIGQVDKTYSVAAQVVLQAPPIAYEIGGGLQRRYEVPGGITERVEVTGSITERIG